MSTSCAVITADSFTLQNRAIFERRSCDSGRSERHKQNVGSDTDLAQFANGVLRRFGFQFARGGDVRHQRDVNEERVAGAFFVAHLANRFQKRQRFDVADRAADLDDDDVRLVFLGDRADRVFDLVGDVRNDLDRLAEIVAAAFLFDHRKINAAGRPIVRLRKLRVSEAFVVAQIEIGFRAVVSDEDFAVLKRRHRARIDVDVRIELDQRDVQPARLEQAADRRRRQAFSQTRNHAAGYENIFSH